MTSTTTPTLRRAAAWTAAAALALSPMALASTTSAAPAKATTYQVTAKANISTAVAKEDTVKVRGRVTPKAAGEKVVLQQRVGNKKKWTVTGDSKVKSNGTYLLKDKPSTPGSREYRVLKPGSRGIAKGFSKPVTVQVYRWEKLAYRNAVANNVAPAGVTISTDYYGQSLASLTSGAPGSIEFTLGRKCTELRATYALTDDSPTGSTGSVSVSADGAVLASHPLAVGTVVSNESLDLTGVFRLKFDVTTSATPAAIAAIGTPEVLCTR